MLTLSSCSLLTVKDVKQKALVTLKAQQHEALDTCHQMLVINSSTKHNLQYL